MTPVRGDNEKHASASERNACDNRSSCRHLEGRDLSGDEPHTGKQDQQEADLGECDARLMAERKHRSDGIYFGRSVLPVTERNLLNSQAYPQDAAVDHTGIKRSGAPFRLELHLLVSDDEWNCRDSGNRGFGRWSGDCG